MMNNCNAKDFSDCQIFILIFFLNTKGSLKSTKLSMRNDLSEFIKFFVINKINSAQIKLPYTYNHII